MRNRILAWSQDGAQPEAEVFDFSWPTSSKLPDVAKAIEVTADAVDEAMAGKWSYNDADTVLNMLADTEKYKLLGDTLDESKALRALMVRCNVLKVLKVPMLIQ